MSSWPAYALSFFVAMFAAVVATYSTRHIARRIGWVAKPRADRWHTKPTALSGGVGIFLGFIPVYLWQRPASHPGDALLVGCSTGMFLLGFVDDRIQLKPYSKLIGQVGIATIFTIFGLRLHWLPNAFLDQGLTIFWLVGVTNALNLLDNIDGAAAGIAAIAAGYMVYLCDSVAEPGAAAMAAAFAGSVVGFLFFNFNPASIFMGDSGSLFIGFFLAGLSLTTGRTGARRDIVALLSVPVLLLLIPIADTTLVTISRRYHGRSISQGGRDHTSHRLVALGMSERRATLLLWGLALASGGVAVMVRTTSTVIALGVVSTFVMGVLFLMIFIGKVKVYEPIDTEAEGRGRTLLPTLADFTYKRRIFEVLSDVVIIVIAYYGAFLLRFENAPPAEFVSAALRTLPVAVLVQMTTFLALGLYRGLWRYTGIDDLRVIIVAVGAAAAATPLAVFFLFRFEHHSRAVFLINGLLLLIGIAGSRVSFRLLRSWLGRWQPHVAKRVLIYGAGDAGELLVRELRNNSRLGMNAVGFMDDDPQKEGRVIHGVRVLSRGVGLDKLLSQERIDEVLFSMQTIEPEKWEYVQKVCTERGAQCRRMRISLE
jgi:UDP-GlcNAc:undecaprenyl-phosphate GlcNAc-1-phosphate transferase